MTTIREHAEWIRDERNRPRHGDTFTAMVAYAEAVTKHAQAILDALDSTAKFAIPPEAEAQYRLVYDPPQPKGTP